MTVISRQKTGINRTVHPANAIEGTLLVCHNAHLTSGGEIEKRKAWQQFATLPAGCVGFKSLGRRITTFGTGARPVSLSAQIRYQRLTPVGTPGTLEKVNGAALFGGKIYCIARFSSGAVQHFYDGVAVPYWLDNQETGDDTMDAVVATLASRIDQTAAYFATAAGTTLEVTGSSDFSYEANVYNGEGAIVSSLDQAYVAPVPETPATGSVRIDGSSGNVTSITVDGLDILGATITSPGSATAHATAVAAQIEAYSSWSATAIGDVVVLTAPPGSGSSTNGDVVAATGSVTFGDITNMLGGADAVPAVPKIVSFDFVGDFEAEATYQIILGGTDFSKLGTSGAASDFVVAYKNKVWVAVGEYLHFSAINDALEWRPFIVGEEGNEDMSPGAGFLRITDEAGEAGFIRGLAPFGEFLGVFAENAIAFLTVDPDPDNTYRVGEIIPSTGTRFGNALLAQGAQDVLYLSDRGPESLRLRAQVQAPSVQGVGAPVAPLFRDALAGVGESFLDTVQSAMDSDGRVIWVVGSQAFVLSEFQEAGIQAWSTYSLPAVASGIVRVQGQVYVLAAGTIYRLGPTYDDSPVEIVSFFTDRGDQRKQTSYSTVVYSVEGVWRFDALTNPHNFSNRVRLGQSYEAQSGMDGVHQVDFTAGQCALRLTCETAGYAKVHKVALG